jgi:mono/diheme cytochrome c family protein
MNLGPAERKLITEGAVIYKQLCATCHGPDGKGINIPGKDMPAPPLAGSPRVKGDKIALSQLLLNGLTGPVDGKTYADKMPSMWAQSDEWIASALSYIRNSGDLGNKASVVTPEEIKKIRENTPKIPRRNDPSDAGDIQAWEGRKIKLGQEEIGIMQKTKLK